MRRSFNSAERAALFLAADGKCELCGEELTPGWHSDHVHPYSKGGETDVVNGQALCPPCNLRKGNTVTPNLSKWQNDALEKFKTKSGDDYFVVATPGAGKTRLALAAAAHSKSQGGPHKVIVVVPTRHLRSQWSKDAAQFGIHLDSDFENGNGTVASDYDGVVVTYAAIHSNPLLYRRMCSARSIVIMDEVHHVGDSRSWGDSMLRAFETATRRFLMSGTPNRTDGERIPFVPYGPEGFYAEDYLYDYGRAARDKRVDPVTGAEFPVVRLVQFRTRDGEARWISAGQAEQQINLADVGDDEMSNAMRSALDPNGEWIKSVVRAADEELTKKRALIPDAGGLVVAKDQWHAREYASLLRRITGETPTLAISDEPTASGDIAAFSKGDTRWIVAVQMVSEGVDIPRLGVGVMATNVSTELFFRQVVGRIVRSRGPVDIPMATMFIPAIQPMVEFASAIETTVRQAIAEREIEEERGDGNGDGEWRDRESSVVILPAGESVDNGTIFSGDHFSQEEIARTEAAKMAAGLDVDTFALIMFARALDRPNPAHKAPATGGGPVESMAEQKSRLKQDVKNLVGKVANRCYGGPHMARQVNYDLRSIKFPPRDKATLDDLADMKALLSECYQNRMQVREANAAA